MSALIEYKDIDLTNDSGEEVLRILHTQREMIENAKTNLIETDTTLKQAKNTLFIMTYSWWHPKYWMYYIKNKITTLQQYNPFK